jgi:hypothetical protein
MTIPAIKSFNEKLKYRHAQTKSLHIVFLNAPSLEYFLLHIRVIHRFLYVTDLILLHSTTSVEDLDANNIAFVRNSIFRRFIMQFIVRDCLHIDENLPFLSEFEAITDEIEEHLHKTLRIILNDSGDVLIDIDLGLDSF